MVRISKKFIKSSFIYTVAGMLPMASAILLLPFYINGLSLENYGVLSLYLAFSLLIQILVTFSFDASLYVHYHDFKKNKRKLSIFVSSAFFFVLLLGIGVILFFAITGSLAFHFLESITDKKGLSFFPYGILSVSTGVFQALFKIYTNLLQSREMPEKFFWSNLITFMMIASFTIGGLFIFPSSLAGPIGGRFFALFFSGAWVMYRMVREFGVHLNYSWLRSTFHYNVPVLIYQLLQWGINYFDRFLMVIFLPMATIGVYDFAVKCLLILEFVINGLNSSFYPKVLATVVDQEKKGSTPEINRYYHGLMGVTMVLVCGALLFFPMAIDWFAQKPGYQEAIVFIPFLGILYFFKPLRLMVAMPYAALKYTKPLPLFYVTVSVVKFLVMVWWIRQWSVYAVILASGVSILIEIVILYFGTGSRFQFNFNALKLIFAPLFLASLVFFAEFFFGGGENWWLNLIYLLFCLILLSWTYRREVKFIMPSQKRQL